ncbi:YopT-type cysteine protease domain-containing protein [Trinickia caryophylli]|uniref:YopT-like peptidase. Cysteine peptidase. MEROPS family C58 n=1 Tax=Trinickia caryophylli TaxID=28094 RepID=A0A1X7FAZ1_TRICW|nr:YopT-type cysteine protease domain-containing protein [Trinickia caryophylli]PMS10957.1 YopT-type cysteine protease domain-containing protein [Trinickia caryophylli]TRX18905.1 YopT-type cysteine protease domain-containing protein [Trinickia caryophylli]WQE10297.1 YopT-type cysteine protease domain-containing protein [Trinickia caryophylli]SMF48918.1 YopT-like peptidase. Cysteine peptidase. MEROPS family C58 [Trinickia caryophylli]GLU34255.1 hypothetical protein Busp01_40970 [Trinickia caryo
MGHVPPQRRPAGTIRTAEFDHAPLALPEYASDTSLDSLRSLRGNTPRAYPPHLALRSDETMEAAGPSSQPGPSALEGRRDDPSEQGCLPTRPALDRPLTSEGLPNQESPFTPRMVFDSLSHVFVRPLIGRVRRSVRDYGQVTFKFSQTKGGFHRQIMKHRDTSGGTCAALAAHWIRARAQNGDLFERLYTDRQKRQLRIDELHSIKQLTINGRDDDGDEQNIRNLGWLSKHSMKWNLKASQSMIARQPTELIGAILDTGAKARCYKLVPIEGPLFAHTFAAEVTRDGGIVFFDPNFGEFDFSDRNAFAEWFEKAFWIRSGYHWGTFGLSQRYIVFDLYDGTTPSGNPT